MTSPQVKKTGFKKPVDNDIASTGHVIRKIEQVEFRSYCMTLNTVLQLKKGFVKKKENEKMIFSLNVLKLQSYLHISLQCGDLLFTVFFDQSSFLHICWQYSFFFRQ